MAEDKEQEEFYPEYDGLTLAELAQAQVDVKAVIESLKDATSVQQKIFDHLRLHRVPEMMESMGVDTVKLTDIGRLSTRPEIYASIMPDMKDDAYQWLEDNGHGALIKDTVNAGTLKAFLKEQIREGDAFPAELFKVTPYTMATITKG